VADRRTVHYGRDARDDIQEIFEWIAGRAGIEIDFRYITRLETYCNGLETFPERGMRRDDLRRGVRTVGYRRRATIAFRVEERRVVILRVLYGGRDVDRVLGELDDDD
jgi:toxin ParE1/3/4